MIDNRASVMGVAMRPARAHCRGFGPVFGPVQDFRVTPLAGDHRLQMASALGGVGKAASDADVFADPTHTNLNGCARIQGGARRRKIENRLQAELGSGAHVMFARTVGSGRQGAAGHLRGQGEKNCHADI